MTEAASFVTGTVLTSSQPLDTECFTHNLAPGNVPLMESALCFASIKSAPDKKIGNVHAARPAFLGRDLDSSVSIRGLPRSRTNIYPDYHDVIFICVHCRKTKGTHQNSSTEEGETTGLK